MLAFALWGIAKDKEAVTVANTLVKKKEVIDIGLHLKTKEQSNSRPQSGYPIERPRSSSTRKNGKGTRNEIRKSNVLPNKKKTKSLLPGILSFIPKKTNFADKLLHAIKVK